MKTRHWVIIIIVVLVAIFVYRHKGTLAAGMSGAGQHYAANNDGGVMGVS